MTDKKRYPKSQLRNPTQKKLRALFGDLPIVDATEVLKVFPSVKDFKNSSRRDPHNCGFARCAARQIGSTSALVLRATSYFDHVDKDGNRCIFRYKNSPPTKNVVAEFDIGEDVDVSKAFVFYPPSKSLTLEQQRAKGRRLRKSHRGKTILNAWMARDRLRRTTAELEKWREVANEQSTRRPNAVKTEQTKRRITQLRKKVDVLRELVDETSAKAKGVRIRPYRRQRTVGHTEHNLQVRNGTGYMNKLSGPA